MKYLSLFRYQTPSYLVKNLWKFDQYGNEKIANQINDSITESINSAKNKDIPKNENPNKIIDIVEKIIELDK